MRTIISARSELRKVLFFGAVSLCFLFMYEISREPLNGFAPKSHERRVWSLVRQIWRSRSKVKGQGHQGQKKAFFGPFGGLRHVYFWLDIFSF